MAALRSLSGEDGQKDAKHTDGKKKVRDGLKDIKRKQGYVCADYLKRRKEELSDEGVVCTACDKGGRG